MRPLGALWADLLALIRQGLSWWLNELAGLLPGRFARRPENAPLVLDVSAGGATLQVEGRRGAKPVMVPLGGDPLQDRIRVQAALRRGIGRTAVIRLGPSLLMEAAVTLPMNAERALRPILLNQLDRLVPLPADEVVFAHRVTERSTANRTIGVELIVATRAAIERATGLLRAAGLDAGTAIASGEGRGPPVTLWRARSVYVASPRQRRLRRMLEATTVALLIGAYVTYVHRLGSYRDELEQQVAAATKASVAARDLAARNAQTESALTLLLDRQRELDPLKLLDELTKLVPDSMWISQLTVRGRSVELVGYSPKVSDLIARIESNDIFYDPTFRSPITRSNDGKGERFDVSFSVWVEKGTP